MTVASYVVSRLAGDEYRVDGREKVSGEALYPADFAMEGMLWAAVLTATVPHARIVSIDTAAARAMPGVHAVLTGADIGERRLGRVLFDWPVLAYDKVRFIGDHVAAVAAETREIAQAALAAIDVRYEELPALLDAESSIASTTIIHEHPDRYVFSAGQRTPVPHPNMQGYDLTERGDLEAGFAAAARIFEHTFTTPRYFAGYVEPRATLVSIDGAGMVHIVTANKAPFAMRDQFATTTGLERESIVVEPSYIGGDFGSKGLSIDECACYYLARTTGRPVKYVRTYLEDMRGGVVRHTAKMTVRSGVDGDGKFVAFQARLLYDGGAYAAGRPGGSLITGLKGRISYAVPNARVERISAYTNTIPSGQVRDPGAIPVTFAFESHVDIVARELGMDPLAFRRRNALGAGDVDLDGTRYHEPRAVEVLDALRAAVDWDRPRAPGRGRGLALTSKHVGGGSTSVKLALTPAGAVELRLGATEQGAGIFTMAGRVVAAVLDVDPRSVDVARGDTNSVPRDPGTGASRVTHIVGRAAFDAAQQLRVKLEEAGYPGVGWDRAAAAVTGDGPIEIVGTYREAHGGDEPEWQSICAYGVELSVDRETGALAVHDVVFVADVGTIINPVAHQGQIDGGFAFGLGHALTEELHLEDGKIINLSLADYKLPTQADMPPLRTVLLHTDRGPGPFGAKMAGELSTAAVPAAFANAIADACGARITALPLTAERVFAALSGSESP